MRSNILLTILFCFCSIAYAETVGVISLCQGFGGPDAPGQAGCKNFNLDEGPFKAGFEFDKGGMNKLLGGKPSSAKIITPGVICGIGTKIVNDIVGFLNFVPHCEGERMLLSAGEYRDFVDDLNDNFRCIACFKSPDA